MRITISQELDRRTVTVTTSSGVVGIEKANKVLMPSEGLVQQPNVEEVQESTHMIQPPETASITNESDVKLIGPEKVANPVVCAISSVDDQNNEVVSGIPQLTEWQRQQMRQRALEDSFESGV